MTPERLKYFESVVSKRQGNLTLLLENVHDAHNVGAVLRTCDSVGIAEVFVLVTHEGLWDKYFPLGKRSTMGARRWVDVHYYKDTENCIAHIRSKYQNLLAACVEEHSKSLYELDLSGSTVFMFGNEHDGLSQKVLSFADGKFYIPQMGMTKSLNISVACAVSLYEALRQRHQKNMYNSNPTLSASEQSVLLEEYVQRSKNKEKRRKSFPKE